jgi:DNA-binding transcriptional LysR family regulator
MNRFSDLSDLAPRLAAAIRQRASLSQAARDLGVSQPAASKALRRAETLLGLPLLRRDQRPLRLTAEGRLLAEFAERREALEARLAERLDLARRQGAGIVRIASLGASASTLILPRIARRLTRAWPEMRVEILEYPGGEAFTALRDDRTDFATLLETEAEDLDQVEVAQDRLVALLRSDDPLASCASLDAATLAARPFIMTKAVSEYMIRAWFAQNGHAPDVTHTAHQATSIFAMVRAGLGVSVIASLAVPEHLPGRAAVPLSPDRPRRIFLARRAGSPASHAAELAWRIIRETGT